MPASEVSSIYFVNNKKEWFKCQLKNAQTKISKHFYMHYSIMTN
jgi:hypothetical protein